MRRKAATLTYHACPSSEAGTKDISISVSQSDRIRANGEDNDLGVKAGWYFKFMMNEDGYIASS